MFFYNPTTKAELAAIARKEQKERARRRQAKAEYKANERKRSAERKNARFLKQLCASL